MATATSIHLDSSRLRGFLGVSLGSSYYSTARLRQYLAWARVNCSRFAFLIRDYIYSYTYSVFRQIPLAHAEKQALRMGDDMATAISRAKASVIVDCEIIRWRDLQLFAEYGTLLAVAESLYVLGGNSPFSKLIREQVVLNLRRKLFRIRNESQRSLSASDWERLDRYVLHEIAGLITMSEFAGYPLEVYPASDLRIIKHIYDGRFPQLMELLPKPPRRCFLTLMLD